MVNRVQPSFQSIHDTASRGKPNDTIVRGAEPARKTFIRPKPCKAPPRLHLSASHAMMLRGGLMEGARNGDV